MDFCGIQFLPLTRGGLYWPSQQTLLVADLHLGKEASFCREGIAVPRGASEKTLLRVREMVEETGALSLGILGDLFHARTSLAQDVRVLFASFLESLPDVSVTLVLGNHDRAAGALPEEWPLKIKHAWSIEGVSLTHFPSKTDQDHVLTIAGHTHPAVKLRGSAVSEGKLACFHYDAGMKCLTLPAVGEFTGTALVQPRADDRVWIMTDHEVLEMDVRAVQSRR